jgi:hypothetical protein
VSSNTSFEPIEPGGSGLERLLPKLWIVVWLVMIYLGIAWWRGEPPSWRTVFNVFSVAAVGLGLLGWRGSPQRRLERRLRRLFASGRLPDAAEVYEILEGTGSSEFKMLTDRYAAGLVPPELYATEMRRLLKMAPEGAAAAALVLLVLCAIMTPGAPVLPRP